MKKMKKLLLLITLVAGVIAFALPGQATLLTYELNESFPGSDKPDPDDYGAAGSWWLKAVFDDNTGNDKTVKLTLTANLTDTNKVGFWYFNLDPSVNSSLLDFKLQSSPTPTAPEATNIHTGNDVYNADGDGYFDIKFDFPTSITPLLRSPFDNSDSITYLIESPEDILVSSFEYLSVPNPGGVSGEGNWSTAAHIQDISDVEGSTWIGAKTGGTTGQNGSVPEPATMLLLGSGLIGLALFGGKKRFKRRNG